MRERAEDGRPLTWVDWMREASEAVVLAAPPAAQLNVNISDPHNSVRSGNKLRRTGTGTLCSWHIDLRVGLGKGWERGGCLS